MVNNYQQSLPMKGTHINLPQSAMFYSPRIVVVIYWPIVVERVREREVEASSVNDVSMLDPLALQSVPSSLPLTLSDFQSA